MRGGGAYYGCIDVAVGMNRRTGRREAGRHYVGTRKHVLDRTAIYSKHRHHVWI